jgi:hypothetical protein
MAAMVCLVGMTKDAGATVTIDLEWGACTGCVGFVAGSTSATVSGAGTTLRLDIYLTHSESGGLTGHGFSLDFDTDGLNELNAGVGTMIGVEWAGSDIDPGTGVAIYGPIGVGTIEPTPESSAGITGELRTFESGHLTLKLPINGAAYTVGTVTATAPARYRVGQAFFTTTGTLPPTAISSAACSTHPTIFSRAPVPYSRMGAWCSMMPR